MLIIISILQVYKEISGRALKRIPKTFRDVPHLVNSSCRTPPGTRAIPARPFAHPRPRTARRSPAR